MRLHPPASQQRHCVVRLHYRSVTIRFRKTHCRTARGRRRWLSVADICLLLLERRADRPRVLVAIASFLKSKVGSLPLFSSDRWWGTYPVQLLENGEMEENSIPFPGNALVARTIVQK